MISPRLIVGLGNPGTDYEFTRHNVGFMVIDSLLKRLPGESEPVHKAESFIWTRRFAGKPIYLQKPLTYMNESGKAIAKLCRTETIAPHEVLVIVDDVHLNMGEIRLRTKGSSGGHNGLESIIDELDSNQFNRMRIGVNAANEDELIEHVLGQFSEEEMAQVKRLLPIAEEAVLSAIRFGIEQSMNRFNAQHLTNKDESNEIDESNENAESNENGEID